MRVEDVALILGYFDLKKYFDSESLKDAMNSIYNFRVKEKLYNLKYELNNNNKIRMKTSVGVSEAFDVGPTVAKGSIDYSVNRFFQHSSDEACYKDLRLQALIY